MINEAAPKALIWNISQLIKQPWRQRSETSLNLRLWACFHSGRIYQEFLLPPTWIETVEVRNWDIKWSEGSNLWAYQWADPETFAIGRPEGILCPHERAGRQSILIVNANIEIDNAEDDDGQTAEDENDAA